jgi:glycosyltransferase involved in cell wall biosynthesis
MKRRVAFVIQRYGPDVSGGAELHCRWIAEHLAPLVEVDVLTTCAIDVEHWANEYPPGVTELNGVHVHRFVVDPLRDPLRFQAITRRVLTDRRDPLDQWNWMRTQGPISLDLLRFIAAERDQYNAFIFFTYLYATTFYGLQLVPDKAILVPTAHDEPVIYLDIFRPVFNLPRFIIYNTEAERQFVQRISGNKHVPSAIVGTGINVPSDVSGDRFRAQYGLDGNFVVYIGRVDPSKNVAELFDYFLDFRAHDDGDLKLAVMGKGVTPIPSHPDVLSLGFVSEQDKFDGLQAALALITPSKYESLSMTVLEAWLVGTPVLVNGDCEVLKEQCRVSKGGLWYQSKDEFDVALRTLLTRSDLRGRLAKAGQTFAAETYAWPHIENCYLEILANLTPAVSERKAARR